MPQLRAQVGEGGVAPHEGPLVVEPDEEAPELRAALCRLLDLLEPVPGEDAVAVGEPEHIAPGLPGRRVHLPGPALGTADDSASVQPLQGAVGTAAVGEEDFRLSLQGLQIGETLADGPRLVVDGDDEGNLHGRTPWRKSLRT